MPYRFANAVKGESLWILTYEDDPEVEEALLDCEDGNSLMCYSNWSLGYYGFEDPLIDESNFSIDSDSSDERLEKQKDDTEALNKQLQSDYEFETDLETEAINGENGDVFDDPEYSVEEGDKEERLKIEKRNRKPPSRFVQSPLKRHNRKDSRELTKSKKKAKKQRKSFARQIVFTVKQPKQKGTGKNEQKQALIDSSGLPSKEMPAPATPLQF